MIDFERARDVTRDENGRLVWQYEGEGQPRSDQPQEPYLGQYQQLFAHNPEIVPAGHIPRGGSIRELWTTSPKKKKYFFAAGAFVAAIIALLLFLPRTSPAATVEPSESLLQESTTVEFGGAELQSTDSTHVADRQGIATTNVSGGNGVSAAVRNFVLSGQVSRWVVHSDLTAEDISVTTVNKSGDLVLVDASAKSATGEKEFATLLLQKVAGEWQIREVY